jgi:hypothetical protein
MGSDGIRLLSNLFASSQKTAGGGIAQVTPVTVQPHAVNSHYEMTCPHFEVTKVTSNARVLHSVGNGG